MAARPIVIGIDGGGTTTRALAVDLTGRRLASAFSGGAAPGKNANARENVRQAIREVITKAGRTLSDVAALVAGLAELDEPKDEIWANDFTALPELVCPRLHVNDAVVAHAGALESRPGIIAIAGTGTIIFGMTETGEAVRNYDFHHSSPAHARALSYATVHSLLAGETEPADTDVIEAILHFWNVDSVGQLRVLGRAGFIGDHFERSRRFGDMAPLVTAAALEGAPLACRACDQAACDLSRGIRLVGGCFERESISIALIGSLIRSSYMQTAMARILAQSENKRYCIVEPAFSSEVGAALMALQLAGVETSEGLRATLRRKEPTPLA